MDTNNIIVNVSGDCFDYVRVFSDGIWNVKPGDSILHHSLVRFHLQLLTMFFLAAAFRFLLHRHQFSRFTSDVLAGIVLGPTVMGKYLELLFPTAVPDQVVASLSKIGYLFFIFFAGVRMDMTMIRRTGKRAFVLGILLAIITFELGENYEFRFAKNGLPSPMFSRLYLLSVVQTQFVGVSSLLMQLKIINSQLGHLALASSLVNELFRMSYTTFLGFRQVMTKITVRQGYQTIGLAFIFFSFILIALRQMMFAFIRRTPEGQPMKEIYSNITVALVFILASCGDSAGLNYTMGPFIFGLVVPARSPLGDILVAKFDAIVSGFLLPLLTMICATKINLWDFFAEFNGLLLFHGSLIGFTIKLVVTFIGVFFCEIPLRHAVVLTIILNAKGVFEVGTFFSFSPLADMKSVSGLVLLFMLQAFQPLLVKKLYHPAEHYVSYTKKTIEHASDDAELQILTCAHRPEDAVAAIKLLECSNPAKRSPLSIYGLCLEELISSFTPVLINHQLGQKVSSSEVSRSKPTIDVFSYFKSQHEKSVQVNVFTAISPLQQMDEDICWLSFEKACSLIILPFHKKWNGKGKMVSNNTDFRNLNINVLERAPCSVAILIDRSGNHDLSSIFLITSYRVAILFFGGPDDREALAYALRMARSPTVHLTILHFIAEDDVFIHQWQNMLDNEFLRKAKAQMPRCANINYMELKVKDGSDTSTIVQSKVEDYDLIIVGSHHEDETGALSGLSEWSDVSELGLMGDLLASEYVCSPVSVLVIQQQKMTASNRNKD